MTWPRKWMRPTQAPFLLTVSWARTFGHVEAFGIEGTGSYGVGLAELRSATGNTRCRGQSV